MDVRVIKLKSCGGLIGHHNKGEDMYLKLKRNTISIFFIIFGLTGLVFAMNEGDNHHVNAIGVIMFGLACLLGAKHAKNEFHPIEWIIDKWIWLF